MNSLSNTGAMVQLLFKFVPECISEGDFFLLMQSGIEVSEVTPPEHEEGHKHYSLKFGSMERRVSVLLDKGAREVLNVLSEEEKAEEDFLKGRAPLDEVIKKNNELIDKAKELLDD